MSFNKRFYSIADLIILYRKNGIESLKDSLIKSDAVICKDKSASEVIDHVAAGRYDLAKEVLENKLNVL